MGIDRPPGWVAESPLQGEAGLRWFPGFYLNQTSRRGGGGGLDGRSPGPPPVSLIDEISAGTQGFAFKTSLWGDWVVLFHRADSKKQRGGVCM